jgi:hypothetical protein
MLRLLPLFLLCTASLSADEPEAATTRDSLVELLRGHAPLSAGSPELQV